MSTVRDVQTELLHDTRIWGMPVTLSSKRAGTLHTHILSTGHCACYTAPAHFMPVGCIWKELVSELKVAPQFSLSLLIGKVNVRRSRSKRASVSWPHLQFLFLKMLTIYLKVNVLL